MKQKTAAQVSENLSQCFSLLGPPASILQSDNGREFKNKEVLDMIKSSWPGLKMVHGKPRHSQSQGSVERGNRDIEALLATAMATQKTKHWAGLLPMIQLQKNSRYHSGIGRSPLQALTGRSPSFGLEGLNLPDEVTDLLQTEEDLQRALGMVEDEETEILTEDDILATEDDLRQATFILSNDSTPSKEAEINEVEEEVKVGVEEAGATASRVGVKDVNEEAVNVTVEEVGTTASKEVGREVVEEAETTVSKEVDRDVVEEEMNVEVEEAGITASMEVARDIVEEAVYVAPRDVETSEVEKTMDVASKEAEKESNLSHYSFRLEESFEESEFIDIVDDPESEYEKEKSPQSRKQVNPLEVMTPRRKEVKQRKNMMEAVSLEAEFESHDIEASGPTCITCKHVIKNPSQTGSCSGCNSTAHVRNPKQPCLKPSVKVPSDELCTYCLLSESIELERNSVKRKQQEQAQGMLAKSARRYAPANVGDSVRVFLQEVDRGRCEFPNILAVVTDITEQGLFKLATREGYLNSFYSRNQFEVLPSRHLLLEEVDTSQSRPLRSAANNQSQGGGQGFTKCGCTRSCQAGNCKCYKNSVLCNSRCHGKVSNQKCLNHN